MRKAILSILFMLICLPTVGADSQNEIAAITKTAMNYMESWYHGDAKRMKASLHKKLAKRSLQAGYDSKKKLGLTSASDMIAFTQHGYGTGLWRKDMRIEVIVLDYFEDIASVKVVTPHYYEYLHLAKIDKEWVIVNTLYEKNRPTGD